MASTWPLQYRRLCTGASAVVGELGKCLGHLPWLHFLRLVQVSLGSRSAISLVEELGTASRGRRCYSHHLAALVLEDNDISNIGVEDLADGVLPAARAAGVAGAKAGREPPECERMQAAAALLSGL